MLGRGGGGKIYYNVVVYTCPLLMLLPEAVVRSSTVWYI